MTFPRKIGLLAILVAVLAALGHWRGLALPTVRWFFSFTPEPDKIMDAEAGALFGVPVNWPWLLENQAEIVGYGFCGVLALIGLGMVAFGGNFHWNPLTLRKAARFRSIGRGYGSLKLLLLLMAVAMLDQALVGKRALAVKYEGRWSFPAFEERIHLDKDYGGESEEEVDFRKLKKRLEDEGVEGLVVLPPVPWDPTFDSDELMRRNLVMIDGVIHEPSGKQPYDGYAVSFQQEDPTLKVRSGRIRKGVLEGPAQVFDENGEAAGREEWRGGELVESSLGEDSGVEAGGWVQVIYMPLPPSWSQKHFLGTDSKGWDILAQLYGGMQVLFKAAALYIVLTYFIGICLGSLMGYFGGVFDLVMQRVMEILSNVPFLLVVMIISANIGRDRVTLATILLIFCLFSWIGVAIYLRTATYKEKARDYVNAARVLGGSTPRVIFRHILPNVIATIVTLVPFSVSSVITSLTALDFLGFGLPDRYPSWGRLLSDGVSNLSSPWIVSSVFLMMVFVLLLVTFVGEAIREAFDPRTFTTYQ